LTEFAAMVYRLLDTHAGLLPARLQEAAPWMRRQAWLTAYADVDGIDTVLKALSQRVKRLTPLERGAGQLRVHYGELERDFAAFWPELAVFAATLHES
jgi:acyl carrier protein phosphodiesterase